MKKKALKIVLTLIIASIFGYWSYTWYKDTASLLGTIHRDANGVVKIAIHDIKRTLVFDALSNPSYYYDQISIKPSSKKKDSLKVKGIDTEPYALTFFTMPKIEQALFTVCPVENNEALNARLAHYATTKKVTIHHDKDNDIQWITLKPYGVLAWSNINLVACLGLDVSYTRYIDVFTDILVHNKVIQDKNHKWIEKLSQSDDHVTYINDLGKIGLNFKAGEAILSGDLKTQTLQAYPKNLSIAQIPDAFISFYYDANFTIPEHKNGFIRRWRDNTVFKKLQINADSIAKQTNGFINVAIHGKTTQTDTIISYIYDDNFNKVAQKTAIDKEVPKIEIQLGHKNNGIANYLKAQGLVNNNAIFTGIPYYQFYVNQTEAFTTFKTDQKPSNYKTLNSTTFIRLSVDFTKAKDQLSIQQLDPYLGMLQSLLISGQQEAENKVILHGLLKGKLKDVNLLAQIVFGLKNNKAYKEDAIN